MSNANKDEKNIWQQILLRTELRAISGTLRQIDALINNDDTTARQLADIILQDIGLTTRVLTIASSVQYQSSDSSSTGSTLIKAIVRIGFRGLRAICISTAILDNIAKKIPHQPELLSCIAQSFCVAVHSRNVARKTNADAEEAFIAGLMQNIGEMVFWCSSIPKSNQYRDLLNSGFEVPEKAFKKLSDMDFHDVSIDLAKEWQLSEVLQDSLAGKNTDDCKSVFIGKRIAHAVEDGWDSLAINKVLNEYLSGIGFDIMSAMKFMREGDSEANSLVENYQILNQVEETSKEVGGLSDQEPELETKSAKTAKVSKPNKPTAIIRS